MLIGVMQCNVAFRFPCAGLGEIKVHAGQLKHGASAAETAIRDAAAIVEGSVRQLRHLFRPFLTHGSALCQSTRAALGGH